MSFSNYHMFRSELGNTNINNIYGRIDYDLNTTEERMDKVEDILKEFDVFFKEYFSEFFKVELNKEDEVATNNNICKMLEMLATYILTEFGNKKRDVQYNFYTDEERFKKALQANTVDNLVELEHEITTIDILVQQKNFRIVKKDEVKAEDLKREDLLGVVLRDYEGYRSFLKELLVDMLHNGKRVNGISPFKVRKILGQIKDDMNLTKEKLTRPITIEASKGETVIDWSVVDFNNPKHVEALMYFPKTGPSPYSDLSIVIYDFHKGISDLYKKETLKKDDLKLMAMMQRGYTFDAMAKAFGLSGKSSVHKRIATLSAKIARNLKN